jgi:tRNA-binding EMAP/Myf-like protein
MTGTKTSHVSDQLFREKGGATPQQFWRGDNCERKVRLEPKNEPKKKPMKMSCCCLEERDVTTISQAVQAQHPYSRNRFVENTPPLVLHKNTSKVHCNTIVIKNKVVHNISNITTTSSTINMKFSLKKKSEEEGADVVVSTPTKVKSVKTVSSPASTANGSVDAPSPNKSSKFSSLFKFKSSKDVAAAATTSPAASSKDIPVAGLEIRVGRISNVTEHEKEKHEKVYCMDIDIGNTEGNGGGPRQIAAGLRSVMSAKELHGRSVLVLCNIKPKKFGNYYSHGAVLAAASDTTIKLIAVPVDAKVGERVIVPGFGGPYDEVMSTKEVDKLKVIEKVMPHFKTNQFGVPEICGRPLMTTAGVCTCAVRNTAVTQI